MALIKIACGNCEQDIDAEAGETVMDNRLVWHISYSCPNCNAQVEEDGRGMPPAKIREAIFKQEGEWSLYVSETGTGKIQALKILREALDWSLAEVAQIGKQIPGAVTTGTHAEMEWLKKLLSSQGLRTVVNKVTNTNAELAASR